MKKKVIFGGIAFVLLLFGVGYYVANKKEKVTNSVPNYADSVWVLDYVNIRNTLLNNYLFGDKTSGLEFLNIKNYGLAIPNYVVAYSCTRKAPTSLFTSFQIADTVLFYKWLNSLVTEYNFEENNGIYSHKNGLVAHNQTTVAISVGITSSIIESLSVLNDVLESKNLMPIENELFRTIAQSNNHGLVWFKKGMRIERESFLVFTLQDSELRLEGDVFFTKEYRFQSSSTWQLESEKSQASFYVNLGESQFLEELVAEVNREEFKKMLGIELDSILHYSPFGISFFLHPPSTKQETAISYEYDDNFNQVEKKVITQRVVPNFSVFTSCQFPGVFDYLVRDSVIKEIEGDWLFTSFPFSKVFAAEKENSLQLVTAINENPVKGTFDEFLVFESDFKTIDSVYLNYFPKFKEVAEGKNIVIVGNQHQDSTHIKLTLVY